jgi:hypothetical protein
MVVTTALHEENTALFDCVNDNYFCLVVLLPGIILGMFPAKVYGLLF